MTSPPSEDAGAARRDPLLGLFGGALAVAPLLVSARFFEPGETPKRLGFEITAFVLAALVFGRAYRTKARLDTGFAFDRPVLAFVAFTALSVAWAGDRYVAATAAVHAVVAGLFYLLSSRLCRRFDDVRFVSVAVVVGGAGVAVVGVAQAMFGVEWFPQVAPPAATFVNKSVAASFLVLVWPLAAWVTLVAPRGRAAVVATAGCALILIYFGQTFARSAWLAAGAQLAFVAVPLFRARARWLGRKVRLVVLFVVVAVGLSYTSSGLRFFPAEALGYVGAVAGSAANVGSVTDAPQAGGGPLVRDASSSSLTERVAVWVNTMALIGDHPLVGVGARNFAREYPGYARTRARDVVSDGLRRWEKAHNDWVQVTAELGVVGLALLLWLFVTFVRLALRAARVRDPDPVASLRVALSAALLGVAVDAVFNWPLQQVAPPVIAAVLIGGLARLDLESAGGATRALRPTFVEAFFGLALVAIVLGGFLEQRRVRAELELDQANVAATAGDWRSARRHASRSWELDPNRWLTAWILGRAALELGDYDLGVKAMEEVLARRPYQSPALYNLGMAKARTGDPASGIPYLRRAIEIDPTFCRVHHGLASLSHATGDTAAATSARADAERCDREVPPDRAW